MTVKILEQLPWPLPQDAIAAMAAGQVQHTLAAHWQAQAQCMKHPHASGQTTIHHWQPAQLRHATPLVLFHGGSGSWTHWVRSIGPLLEAGHAIWAVDLPGFGASDLPAGAVDADGLLPVLAQLLEALFPLQAVRVVGFSFGAMTAAMLAAAHPHLIRQLMLVGAPGTGVQVPKPFRLKGWRHVAEPEGQLLLHIYNLQGLMLHDAACIDPQVVALHVANVQRDQLTRRRISSTNVLLRALEQVSCPVAAIYGEHDALYPGALDEVQTLLAAHALQWHGMQRIAAAGHWVQYEQPDAFHQALLPWLERED